MGINRQSYSPNKTGAVHTGGNLSHILCIWLSADLFPVGRDMTPITLTSEVTVMHVILDIAGDTDFA